MSKQAKLMVNDHFKIFRSEDYNYNFDLRDGTFMRWGRTQEDDPTWSPFGPEIADIEISASGKNGGGCSISCPMCYKGNNSKPGIPDNMTLEMFKSVFEKFPKIETLKIELENGEILSLSKTTEVLLEDGKITLAEHLKENDNIFEVLLMQPA